ncbi:coiled-coil domain-containing protein [Gimesia algae]|uniref:Uncharacterized protein n=1 Tax=Gimesia algae TaxID=2527971 RepID=A0A517VMY6_9PLAN|nr:hypothetical protein [Gimesia algae]QDT94356.1 hypothetical protein Pan161_60520 [Gimesia algae]
MVDVQRNVIISLKLAGDPKNQTIAEQFSLQAISAASQAEVAAKRTRDMNSRNEKGMTKDAKDESDKRIEQYAKDMEAYDKRRKLFAKKLKEYDRTRIESNQKANESAVEAIQGMADMAEGMAKLGLVSEENFEKFAKNFEMIQKGVRVFKGATDVWWKGREALIALSAATKAQTAHNNLLAASNLRVGATQVVGGVAGQAGGAAAGRAGGGVVGGAVAGAAGGVGAGAVGGGSVLAGAAIVGKMAAVGIGLAALGLALHDGAKTVLGVFYDFGENSGRASGAILDLRKASSDAAEAVKKTAEAEKKREALIRDRDRYTKEETTRLGLQSQLLSSSNRVSEAKGIARNETGLQNAERVRLEAVREIQLAEAELADRRINEENRLNHNRLASNDLALRLLNDRESAQKRLYDAEVNRLNIIRSQNQATEAALKADRERLVTLQEQKRLEEKGLNAKLGELNPGLQKHAIGVAEKIKSGKELTLRDINIMKEAGVGQDQITNYYSKKGSKLKGADTFTEVFGSRQTKNDIADAQERADENRQKLIEGKKLEGVAGQSVTSSANNLDQVTQARVKFEAELKLMFTDLVTGLGNSANDIRQANADAVDAIHQQSMATLSGIKAMQAEMEKSHTDMQQQFAQFQLQQKSYQ